MEHKVETVTTHVIELSDEEYKLLLTILRTYDREVLSKLPSPNDKEFRLIDELKEGPGYGQ